MARVGELPRDQAAEDQLIEQIRTLSGRLEETVRQLVDARTELEIRQRIAIGNLPGWLRPPRNITLTQAVLSALGQNTSTGLAFKQLLEVLRRAGRDVKNPSVTAILGRLKREGRVARRKGRWVIATYTYQEPERAAQREYENDV